MAEWWLGIAGRRGLHWELRRVKDLLVLHLESVKHREYIALLPLVSS